MGDVEAYQDKGGANRRPSQAAQSVGGYSRRDGDDLTTAVWSLGGPLSLTLFGSIVQAAAAITTCSRFLGGCTGVDAYAVSLGVVSALIIGIYFVIFAFKRNILPEKSMLAMSVFLFLWWGAGVGITTFANVTTIASIASTAYFATWCSFFFSGLIMHSEWSQFRSVVSAVGHLEASSRSTFFLLLASIIELISAAVSCGTLQVAATVQCDGGEIYAIIVGVVSFVLCILLLRVSPEKFQGTDRGIALFLAIWWAAAMGFLTIAGPFVLPNNGFFSTWLGFFAAFYVAQHRIFPHGG